MRAATASSKPVRWRDSLIIRVILLCVVLLVCLLGSVSVITHHYFREMVEEMRTQTQQVADSVVLQLEENPDFDWNMLEQDMSDLHHGINVQLQEAATPEQTTGVSVRPDQAGRLVKYATQIVPVGDTYMLLTVSVALTPQTEIVRAFKNKYLLLLAIVFVITLVLMVYFIGRILRPLKDLSDSCAKISRGEWQDVEVRRNSGEILALEQVFNGMVGSLREKEMMETKLRQAQRLSSIGTLAAGVAHDIRNPLNAIKLLSGHTMDVLGDDESNARASKSLKTIRDEVNRLEDIVSSFLSLARERELEPEPNRVDTLLDECVQLVSKDAEARGVRLVSDLRAGDTTLMLDGKQCVRAILNIIINAMEVCPEGGRVRMFSRVTDLACEIEVRDDGPGLTPEVAEHAFDAYYTTKSGGTGLGLSITRGIIEEHGGTIELSGTDGHGCQVLITFPLRKEVS